MKRKHVFIPLLFLLLTTLNFVNAFAAGEFKIGSKTYNSLGEAFEAAKDGNTISLTKDALIQDSEAVFRTNGTVTLNLNKHILKVPGDLLCVPTIQKGTLIVKNGTLRKTTKTGRIFRVNGGNLKIKDGTYKGGISVSGGSLQIDGGTLSNLEKNNFPLILIYGGKVTINGGTLKASNGPTPMIYNQGTLTVSGGTLSYTAEISDEYSDTFRPEYENGSAILTEGDKAKTVINGGTIKSRRLVAYVIQNGSLYIQKGKTVPTLTATEGCVIASEDGKLIQIKDGKIKAGGGSGTIYNGGTVCNISGGTFYSGWTILENDMYGEKGTVNISGGTFTTTTTSKDIAMILNHYNGTINIKGGKFTGKNTYGYWNNPDEQGKINVSNKNLFANTLGEKTGRLFE